MAIELGQYLENTWTYKRGVSGDIKLTVLAAGLGSRMKPLTAHHLPKPMFPIGGSVPLTEMWVRRSVESGITDISMNLCVLSDAIRNYYKDGAKFGADISFVEEDMPTGTLGGICKQALGKNSKLVLEKETLPGIEEFNGTTIIAPSGDIVTDFDPEMLERMYAIHKEKGAALTMVLTPVPWETIGEFGTVELENPETLEGAISKSGKIVNFREKDANSPSNLNNASIYMIEKSLLKLLDPLRTAADASLEKPFYDFGKHVFPAMLGQLDYVDLPDDLLLWGIKYDGLWHDVGRKRDYLMVNKSYLDGEFHVENGYEKYPWGYLGTNTSIDFSNVNIIPPVVIGNNCTIEAETTIGPYAVIGDDWTIKRNATVSNSVLWQRHSYYQDEGGEISVQQRKVDDLHCINKGVTVDQSIIVGGSIESDLIENTAAVLEDGSLQVLSIDWTPSGKRA